MNAVDTKMIKSARRVLEVLEFFDQSHATATVMDISRSLGYPQSSTSELLRCLVALGYLHYNRYTRSYQPTARVALIGAWVEPDLFRDGALLPLVDAIAHQFGQTVLLSICHHYQLQHIHVVQGVVPGDTSFHVGDTSPVLHNIAGRLLLATYQDVHIRPALRRFNAEESDPSRRVVVAEEIERLRVLRNRKWALDAEEETATLSIMLPPRRHGQRIALSVVGKRDAIVDAAESIRAMVAQAPVGGTASSFRQASNDDEREPAALHLSAVERENAVFC